MAAIRMLQKLQVAMGDDKNSSYRLTAILVVCEQNNGKLGFVAMKAFVHC
jgi:hypothetical protein